MILKKSVFFLLFFVLVISFQNFTSFSKGEILGNLNGVKKFPKGYLVWGWVCAKNQNVNVQVRLYFRKPNGQKVLWRQVLANKTIGNDVETLGSKCGTTNVQHRFIENIPYQDILKYNGFTAEAEALHGDQIKNLAADSSYSQKVVLDHTSAYTKSGWIKGEQSRFAGFGNVVQFKGVPYARPPVGRFRWARPFPPVAWSGEKNTTQFSNACAQVDGHLPVDVENSVQRSEDCLYLNIWKPKNKTNLPVVVYIHGGGFKGGYSGLPDYDGTYLASQDSVVVTFNYRVGMFGFFSHPYLKRIGRGNINFGLADQEFVLKWVKDNIGEFGGNRNNVTIVGSSAGGASVAYWTASDKGQGLFHRGIIESGGGSFTRHLESRETAEARGSQVIHEVLFKSLVSNDQSLKNKHSACQKSAGSGSCFWQLLFNTPTSVLQNTKYFNLYKDKNTNVIDDPITNREYFEFHPFLDNNYVKGGTIDRFKCGQQKDIPLIIGSQGWEADIVEAATAAHPDNFYYGMNKNTLSRVYDIPHSNSLLAERVYGDKTFGVPSRILAKHHSKKNDQTYWYFFNYIGDNMTHHKGAKHSSLDLFTFQSLFTHPGLKNYLPTTNKDRAVAKVWSGYWLNFYRGTFDSQKRISSPAARGLASWQPYDEASDNRLFINNYGAKVSSQTREFGDEHTRNINRLLKQRYDYVEDQMYPDNDDTSSCGQ